MQFKCLRLQNFKSFAQEATLDFEALGPGLHFLSARNSVEPRLGSNGSGKSTLWDALHWCLYGKTVRGTKATNVRTWGASGPCTVKLDMVHHGSPYRLIRQWGPNKLLLGDSHHKPRNIDQNELNEFLGLSSDAFQHAILAGNSNPMFFDLSPADKLSLFSQIMDLERWMQRAQQASEKAKEYNESVANLQRKQASLEGKLEQLQEQEEHLRESSENFSQDIKDQISDIEEEIKKVQERKKKTLKELREAEAALRTAEPDLEELGEDLESATDIYEGIRSELAKYKEQDAALKAEIQGYENELKRIQGVEGTCPICNQEVSESHIRTEIDRIQGRISNTQRKRSVLSYEMQDAKVGMEEAKGCLGEIQQELERSQQRVRGLERTIATAEQNSRTSDEKITHLKDQIHDLSNRTNSYEEDRQECKNSQSELKEKLSKIGDEIQEAEKYASANSYWSKGFKEVRLFIIEEALKELEVEVNNCFVELGLTDWEVHFDVERETKSGGVSKGFTVFIKSPHNEEPVPWESWSGGEGQRLRLGGTMGLSSLILNQTGIESNIEVWDEPSQHLSPEGVQDLVGILHQRAREHGKQIWLVDHTTPESGLFESIVQITKDEQGSRIEL